MEYLTLLMIVAIGAIAIWSAVKPQPVLWIAVLLLDILFAVGAYGHLTVH